MQWVEDDDGRDPYMYPPTVLHRDWQADRREGHGGDHNELLPWYSSNLPNAMKLIEPVRARGWFVSITPDTAIGCIVEVRDQWPSTAVFACYAEATPSLALCRMIIDLAKSPMWKEKQD